MSQLLWHAIHNQPHPEEKIIVNDRLITPLDGVEVPYISANIGDIFKDKQEPKEQPLLNADGSESVYVAPDLGSVLKAKATANEQPKSKPIAQQNHQQGEEAYIAPTLSGTLAGKSQKRK